jgi:uncharacterized protein (DUF3820 family)
LHLDERHKLNIHFTSMDRFQEQMLADLQEIGRTRMPFGKYGPDHYPPAGLPIYELPSEYLGWFLTKGGFPKGRLGVLLAMVYQMKVDGCDEVFNVLRKPRNTGGP